MDSLQYKECDKHLRTQMSCMKNFRSMNIDDNLTKKKMQMHWGSVKLTHHRSIIKSNLDLMTETKECLNLFPSQKPKSRISGSGFNNAQMRNFNRSTTNTRNCAIQAKLKAQLKREANYTALEAQRPQTSINAFHN